MPVPVNISKFDLFSVKKYAQDKVKCGQFQDIRTKHMSRTKSDVGYFRT